MKGLALLNHDVRLISERTYRAESVYVHTYNLTDGRFS
jgi:hypothetical protein